MENFEVVVIVAYIIGLALAILILRLLLPWMYGINELRKVNEKIVESNIAILEQLKESNKDNQDELMNE
jgi:hypothetical protein